MIVDAHAHVWKADPKYPNPAVTTMSPASDVPLDLLRQYMDEHGVGRTVLVQPMFPGEDNSLVADAARAEPGRYAAVAVVDPRKPDLLEYWVRERGCRGLRLRPKFAGEADLFEHDPLWERAARLGIVISVLANLSHVPAIARRAERFPGVPLIVDHLAHPDVAAGVGSPDFQALLALARLPNVSVKPTGFYYYSKTGYPYDDCGDFFRAVYDRFGPDRLIWGSDFPHVLLKTDYGRSLNLFESRYPWLAKGEREKILGGNAERLYFTLPRPT
jgi:L-fuconolactonase